MCIVRADNDDQEKLKASWEWEILIRFIDYRISVEFKANYDFGKTERDD